MLDDARLLDWFTRHEGNVPHMYRDARGNVAVGIRHPLESPAVAQRLAFMRRADGERATRAEIAADYDAIAAQPVGLAWPRYRAATTLELPTTAIEALFLQRIARFRAELTLHFTGYEAFPEAARLALLDIAYDVGGNGLLTRFPRLVRGVRAGDWAWCARECTRADVTRERDAATRALFEAAAVVRRPTFAAAATLGAPVPPPTSLHLTP